MTPSIMTQHIIPLSVPTLSIMTFNIVSLIEPLSVCIKGCYGV
jgi:hypothetical protein